MDIQVAWQNLVSAIEQGLWGEASEIADDVLEWLAKDGLPPTIIGKPFVDKLIAKALAESVAGWDV